jgi:hypothetical protein
LRFVKSWIIAMTLALSGCAALHPGADELAAVDRITGEALVAARAPLPEQKSTLARAQAAFAQNASPVNRLRLATLLAALPAPLRDEPRAAELLEPLANASAPGIGRFAALLSAHLAERLRLVREIERAARDRERADKERDKREEQLRQQLEAMRAIEQGILEREEKLRRRQR